MTAAPFVFLPTPPRLMQSPDSLLVHRMLDGDRAARAEFVRRARLVPRVIAAKNRSAGAPLSVDEQKDVVQDVFLEMQRRLSTFPVDGVLERWMYHFAMFVFFNRARAARRRRPMSEAGNGVIDPVERTYEPLDLAAVHEGLSRLDDRDRELIRWRYFDDLPFDEIAERQGVPVGTVKDRVYRARERLRRFLSPWFGDRMDREAGKRRRP